MAKIYVNRLLYNHPFSFTLKNRDEDCSDASIAKDSQTQLKIQGLQSLCILEIWG